MARMTSLMSSSVVMDGTQESFQELLSSSMTMHSTTSTESDTFHNKPKLCSQQSTIMNSINGAAHGKAAASLPSAEQGHPVPSSSTPSPVEPNWMPPLESVQLDKTMTEVERAEMIRKRNAVYSKRKYYKKKTNIARLVEQRHQFQTTNNELKQEHQRLLNLLDECRQKVEIIEAHNIARFSTLSAHGSAAVQSPSALALQWGTELGGGLPLQYLSATPGFVDPRLLAMPQFGTDHLLYPDLQASVAASRRGYVERKLEQNANETALLLSYMQNNHLG